MGDERKTVDEYVSKYKKYDIFVTALNKRFSCISMVWLKNSNTIIKIDKVKPDNIDNTRVTNYVISNI